MIQYIDLVSDTIFAPVTPQGYSSVAVIRVSGDKAWLITKRFVKKKKKPKTHQVFLSSFKTPEGEELDHILVTYFKKGKSFTGDETVELACHGNPMIVNAISGVYLKTGCRMAEPGEFSFRAFYNGKIDLVQAESIQKLITNNSLKDGKISFDQLKGSLSTLFNNIEKKTIKIISHLEAQIDFVEEDVDPDENEQLVFFVESILKKVNQLLASYEVGRFLGKNQKILICGPANVGKSSLLNRLFNEEKAIVTNQKGTTRDLVVCQTFLGHHSVEFIDSAGIRETEDPIEKIGIKKILKTLEDSSLILYVIDNPDDLKNRVAKNFLKKLPKDRCFLVFNKIDLFKIDEQGKTENQQRSFLLNQILQTSDFDKKRVFFISALKNLHLEELRKGMETFMEAKNSDPKAEGMITQARHFNHLSKFQKNLCKALELLKKKESPDLISQEIMMGLREVHLLLGKKYDDEILDRVFSEFCIGK